MSSEEKISSVPFPIQVLIGCAAGGILIAIYAVLALMQIPLGLFHWLILFVIVWIAVFVTLRMGMRGVLLGMSIACIVGYAVVAILINRLQR